MPRTVRSIITGTGTAVHGLSGAADLLGTARSRGTPFDATTELSGREMRSKDRGSRLAIRAAGGALAAAGRLDRWGRTTSPDTTAIIVSSNLGNVGSVCELIDTITAKTAIGLNPMRLPETACSVVASSVAIRFRLRGPNITICNGATSGLDAMFWARTLISAERADAVIVIGVEPTNEAVRALLGADSVDGAAALVLEPAGTSGVRDRIVTVAGYGHARDAKSAIETAGLPEDADVGLWLTESPEQVNGRSGIGGSRTLSIEQRLGRCSGALGVFQCVAAAAHLGDGGSGPVLAIAGGRDEPTAAVVLTAVLDGDGNEHSLPYRKGYNHAWQ